MSKKCFKEEINKLNISVEEFSSIRPKIFDDDILVDEIESFVSNNLDLLTKFSLKSTEKEISEDLLSAFKESVNYKGHYIDFYNSLTIIKILVNQKDWIDKIEIPNFEPSKKHNLSVQNLIIQLIFKVSSKYNKIVKEFIKNSNLTSIYPVGSIIKYLVHTGEISHGIIIQVLRDSGKYVIHKFPFWQNSDFDIIPFEKVLQSINCSLENDTLEDVLNTQN